MPDAARFTTADLLTTTAETWREFLRVDDLSLGIYTLEVGETDEQSPHAEDEIYVVLEGAARLQAGDEDYEARAGAILYVKAHVEHRFHDITERLRSLVLFAPAESDPSQPVAVGSTTSLGPEPSRGRAVRARRRGCAPGRAVLRPRAAG